MDFRAILLVDFGFQSVDDSGFRSKVDSWFLVSVTWGERLVCFFH